MIRTLVLALLPLSAALLVGPRPRATEDVVRVGCKPFPESRLLAEMFVRLLEERAGVAAERVQLEGTMSCFGALRSGDIDVYPEYTGTGLAGILDETASGGRAATLRRVRRVFLDAWDLWWLAPLGFENSYEIAVPRAVAARYDLKTISDLARVSGGLRAGFGFEFKDRSDGLPGLRDAYGLRFREVVGLKQANKYEAASSGAIDCLDVYTTDGRLLVHDLVMLEDDRGFFPPYDAAPLARGASLLRHPLAGNVLSLLGGALNASTMQSLNLRLQAGGETVERVAQDALVELGLCGPRDVTAVSTRDRSLLGYMWAARADLWAATRRHLVLSGAALACALLLALPLALLLERWRAGAESVVRVVAMTQTIPSIALLAFMIPLLGIGFLPALVALWIYAVFPILRSAYTGLRDAAPDAVAASQALGMTGRQVLLQVRLPLAVPVLMSGVRTAAVLIVGTATLAAFIGAGGLGEPIVTGLQLSDPVLILSGALPAALLALLVDLLLGLAERALRPRGL